MAHEVPLTEIKDFVSRYISQWPEIFLVDISIGTNSNKVSVFLDGDNGITIDRCAEVNRALYKFVENEEIFSGDNFSLEVSSPGIDRPLKLQRQYLKNIGRTVEVIRTDMTRETGKLVMADEEKLLIEKEVKPGKKQSEKIEMDIPFGDIKQVKVLVKF